jgi:hypothetical protein
MGLRKRHGNGARAAKLGSVVEVQPLDEQATGMQAAPVAEAPGERRPNGQLAPGSRTIQSKGGHALKQRTALAADPAIREALAAPEFRPMLRKGTEFRKAIQRQLATMCGGGECDKLTSGVVSIAADQLAASKFFMARAAKSLDPADFMTASRLGDAARQNLIAARELASKHGEALKDTPLGGHHVQPVVGSTSRRAELAARLAAAPTMPATSKAAPAPVDASEGRAEASADELDPMGAEQEPDE